MRRSSWSPIALATLAALAALPLTACGSPTPTGEEIERSLDAQLRSVAGPWTGSSSDQTVALSFQLTAGSGGQVSGTGTMQERGKPTAVPVTISGSYRRPELHLTFEGMVYEGRAVGATFRGSYTTVGGVSDILELTAEGYTRRLTVLLQETTP